MSKLLRDKFLRAALLKKELDHAISEMMADVGRLGGSVKSSKKKQASARNGKRGGRPTKQTP